MVEPAALQEPTKMWLPSAVELLDGFLRIEDIDGGVKITILYDGGTAWITTNTDSARDVAQWLIAYADVIDATPRAEEDGK